MIREDEDQQYVGNCPLTLSRGSSTYSEMSLVRVCSYTSSNQQDIVRSYQQRFFKLDTLFESIDKIILELVDLIALDKDLIFLLLHKYNWKIDILKEQYYSHDYQQFTSLQKIKNIWITNRKKLFIQCPICHDLKQSYNNFCGHSCCFDCWSQYFGFGIINERQCFFKCIQEGCKQPVFHSFIIEFIKDRNIFNKNILINYIQNTKSLSFCPGANCDYCFEDSSCLSKTVNCIGCGTSFCFKCTQQSHQPCTCKQALDWNLLTKKQKCSESWIKMNTKKCPHCKLSVEKTLGCDFIVCACKNKFCYKCQKNWDQKHCSHFLCPYETLIKPLVINETSMQIHILNKTYNSFLLNDSRTRSLKQGKYENLKQRISQYVHLPESQIAFISKGKQTMMKLSALIKWGQIFQYFNQKYKNICERNFHNFKNEIILCNEMFNELDRKISKVFINSQFLQTPGSKVKQFYRQKQQIQNMIRNMQIMSRNYLIEIGRE